MFCAGARRRVAPLPSPWPPPSSAEQEREVEHRHHLAAQVDEPGDERRHQKQPRQRPLGNGLLDRRDRHAEVLSSDVEAE